MIHNSNHQLHKGSLVIDDKDEAAIIVDDFIESPIRLIRKNGMIMSAFVDFLEEVDLEDWKKLMIVKLRSPD